MKKYKSSYFADDKYRIVSEIECQQWSDFVLHHPRGNIFQTPEMFDVFKATKNNEPVLTAALDDKGNRVAGVLISVIQGEYPGIVGRFTSRSITWGGPLVSDDNKEIIELLIEQYNEIIKRKAIYSQFRNLWDQEDFIPAFNKNNYNYEKHLNIHVDLGKTEEELWKEVNSKRRNEIRRAKKEGTTFKELTSKDEIDRAYRILKKVYTRAKLPLHDKSLFNAASKILHPKGMIKFFGAINQGKIIGAIVVLCYKDRVYDWYAGSLREYYDKYPNDLLPWEVFLWGGKNGYKIFDFGGAGKPGKPYGVRDYKKKFGGEFVNFGRFEKIHKPAFMKLGKFGLKLWQIVR